MWAMHAICRGDHLQPVPGRLGDYLSGWWKLSPEEIESLQGGWLYLHESSARPSWFACRIESASGREEDDLISLHVRKAPEIRNQAWRGLKASQSKANNKRIVPASYEHEL